MGFEKILDNCLVRKKNIGGFDCPPIEDFTYWEVRHTLPYLINLGLEEFMKYFEKEYGVKDFSTSDALSFFYHIFDELKRVRDMEEQNIIFHGDSSVVHGNRAREFPTIMELYQLSGGCPINAQKIKIMKYKEVFECLFYLSIDSEKKIKK